MVINFIKITESTQKLAKEAIKNNEINGETTIFIAQEQTNGVGRTGKTWVSLPGNLYMSVVFANNTLSNQKILSITTALAVDSALKTERLAKYKWPNDLLINGKKLAGILIEKLQDFIIVGVGVNLINSPENVDCAITNLKNENMPDFQANEDGLANIAAKITNKIIKFDQSNNIIGLWNSKAYKLNERLTVELYDKKQVEGIFIGINDKGNMLLKNNNDIIEIIYGSIINI